MQGDALKRETFDGRKIGATNGVGGLRRFVFGTVADELTRKSPISLLVFHPSVESATDTVRGNSAAAAARG